MVLTRLWFLIRILYCNFCFQVADDEKRKRDAEEMGDAMKSLENRTLDSKREMDILAALDEVKSMKVRFLFREFYSLFFVYIHRYFLLDTNTYTFLCFSVEACNCYF